MRGHGLLLRVAGEGRYPVSDDTIRGDPRDELIARLTRERDEARAELERRTMLSDTARLDVMWQQMVAERDAAQTALRDAEDRLKLVQCFRATGNEDLIDAALHGWTRKTERA